MSRTYMTVGALLLAGCNFTPANLTTAGGDTAGISRAHGDTSDLGRGDYGPGDSRYGDTIRGETPAGDSCLETTELATQCADAGYLCGDLLVVGSCGPRKVSCGTCALADSCVQGTCVDCAGAALAPFANEIGSLMERARICTANQLANIAGDPTFMNMAFTLDRDVDLAGLTEALVPIGSAQFPFTGSFDGGGHTIRNLVIDTVGVEGTGLFGVTDGASLRDITLKNIAITSDANNVGALIGAAGGGTVSRCYSRGDGDPATFEITVNSADNIGGLIGNAHRTLIADSGSSVDISASGGMNVGGLVGNISTLGITRSFATGNVLAGSSQNVGGLTGSCWSRPDGSFTGFSAAIYESFAAGAVEGNAYVGGLAGYRSGFCNVLRSYSAGSATGNNTVGGMSGFVNTQPQTRTSYTRSPASGTTIIGGFNGATMDTTRTFDSYWSSEATVGVGDSGSGGPIAALTDLTIAQMGSLDNFPKFARGRPWVIDPTLNAGMPVFHWRSDYCASRQTLSAFDADGIGTITDPFRICTAAQLQSIGSASSSWTRNFVLMDDIDLIGVEWTVIGTPAEPFSGTLHGNDFTVSHLSVEAATGAAGFIGYMGNRSKLSHIRFTDLSVHGAGHGIGGAVGMLVGGTLADVHVSSGATDGVRNSGTAAEGTGGLVGIIEGNSNVSRCWASMNVDGGTGNSAVGGFVGSYSSGMLTTSFAYGQVVATDATHVGGFVGRTASNLWGAAAFGDVMVNGASTNAGGFAGTSSVATIRGCYTRGGVVGTSHVGGFIGMVEAGSIGDAYSTGTVSGAADAWGSIGYITGTPALSAIYWPAEVAVEVAGGAPGNPAGVVGLSSAQMTQSSSVAMAGNGTRWRTHDGFAPPTLAAEHERHMPSQQD